MDSTNHQKLVSVIKGVHQKLRKLHSLSCDPNAVWAEHLKDESLRETYSQAMFKLATEVWNGKESRIDWTYKTCMDYFFCGGLEHSLQRQKKLKEISLQKNLCPNLLQDNEAIPQNNYKNLNRKLSLLDVGSCYNPFSKYEEFTCTAIDLTPATKDVLQCDFLATEIKPQVKDLPSHNDSPEDIFYEESFDIVVLSLVLEYLPACNQRAVFCYKSWQLLRENGLCIIITPDSKSVSHNAQMMKSWKLALEKIGFIRVKYEKLKHIHCIAFRKLKKEMDEMLDSVSELLYIPQDFRTYTEEQPMVERTEEENAHVCNIFQELPNEDIF